jgi:hypothetical protein
VSGEQAARKVALWRRPWLRITTAIIVGLIVYGTVTSLYDVEGKLDQQGSSVASATSGLIAVITPLSVNPASNTAVMRIKFMAPGEDLLDDTGRLAKNTRVTVISSEGAIERTYGAGSVPAPLEVPVGVAGEQAQYPFDSHSGTFGIVVDTYETVDGVIHSTGTVPLAAIGDEGVSGWNTTMDFDAADDDADVVVPSRRRRSPSSSCAPPLRSRPSVSSSASSSRLSAAGSRRRC